MIPERADRQPSPPRERFAAGRWLALGGIALLLFGALIPLIGVDPDPGFQLLAILALITAILGVAAPQGGTLAFMLLWASLGMSAAIGTIGFFSIGLLYLIAAIFLLFAIFTTPNRSDIELRYDMRYIAAFAIGYLGMFFFLFLFAARF